MSKKLSTKSVNNRAARRRHLQPKQDTPALHGSLVDLRPAKQSRPGWTVAMFFVGLVTVASVILFVAGGAR